MRGMVWVAWRQQRLGIAIAAALALAGVVYMAVYNDLRPLLGVTNPEAKGMVLSTVPLLVGVFWGAPLVGRELQERTHRIGFTQSVSRGRWLATKLGMTAVAAIAVSAVAGSLFMWHARAVNLLGYSVRWERVGVLPLPSWGWGPDGTYFPVLSHGFNYTAYPPVMAGYAVLFLAVGVLVGTVTRRVVPAMAITVVACGVVYAVADYLRTTALALAIGGDDGAARKLGGAEVGITVMRAPSDSDVFPTAVWFWTMQGVETAVCVVVAVAVAVVTFRRIRRTH